MRQRIDWIDNVRGLGILLVVFGHQRLDADVTRWVYAFHVPLFFFLSGFLLDVERYAGYREFVLRRLRTVVVPYFFFAAISYVFWLAVTRPLGEASHQETLWFKPLIGFFYGNAIDRWMMPNLPLWFLTCLFVTDQLFFALRRVVGTRPGPLAAGLAVFAVAGFLDARFGSYRWPWSFDVALTAVVFYGVGFLARQRWQIDWRPPRAQGVAIVVVAALVYFVGTRFNVHVRLNQLILGRPLAFYGAAFGGIVLAIALSRVVGRVRPLAYCGRHSLVLLCVHVMMMTLTRVFLRYALGVDLDATYKSIPWALGYTAAAVLLAVPVIELIDRYAPFILGHARLVSE